MKATKSTCGKLLTSAILNVLTREADKCFMGLFFKVWFCKHCGQELCGSCYDLLPLTPTHEHQEDVHDQMSFIPVSFLSIGELNDALQKMAAVNVNSESPPSPMSPPFVSECDRSMEGSHTHKIRRYSLSELSEEEFAGLWTRCEPFILTDVVTPTTPEEILDLDPLKPHMCTTAYYDGSAWVETQSTLEEYFGNKKRAPRDSHIWQIRVRLPFSAMFKPH